MTQVEEVQSELGGPDCKLTEPFVYDQENEVLTEDGGKVLYTSTDQAGNFRIGDDLKINQETGTISGRSFSKSLFSEMTPFILALS